MRISKYECTLLNMNSSVALLQLFKTYDWIRSFINNDMKL